METEDVENKKKKITDDVITFLHKRSQTDATKYGSRLKTCINLQEKKRRAAAARRRSEQTLKSDNTIISAKKNEDPNTPKNLERRGGDEQKTAGKHRGKVVKRGFFSRSRSREPKDCGRGKRKRRRSCGKRRKRKRRRSCSRRRRRRSCRRRRKKKRRGCRR